ncbi:MAG: hypothetical protein NVS1B10_02030 [Candidatus Saccharimonadales bacterium]
MAERIQRVEEYRDDGTASKTTRVVDRTDPVVEETQSHFLAARIIWYIAGILLTLLAFRFVLALLGANPSNAFANFIYTVSHPFVAPFFGLFNYNLQYGVSRFETFTLVAMAVYAIIAYGLAKLFTLNRPLKRSY